MEVFEENEEWLARRITNEDFGCGYKEVLSDLTVAGNLTVELCESILSKQNSSQVEYNTIVIKDKVSGDILGNGVLVVSPDIFHNGDRVGYIEDIVVLKRMQGKGLGYKIIQILKKLAVSRGCYKVSLDCSESNEGFYNKCGLTRVSLECDKRFILGANISK